MTALATVHDSPPPAKFNDENPIGAMLQALTEKGVTSDSVAALERLTDLYLKVDAINAKKAFAVAFAAMQGEMPSIAASKAVPNNNGSIRYKYAPYEEILYAISPLLSKHHFAIAFNSRADGDRVTAICTLTHSGGHSQTNEFAVRIGQGPPGSNTTQADGAAHTYARRGALCNALNIVVEHDTDGRDQRVLGNGDCISEEEAAEIETAVNETNSDPAQFLKFAKATSFATIRRADMPRIRQALAVKYQRLNQGGQQ